MMDVKGYFRAPRLHLHGRKLQAAAGRAAPPPGERRHGGESESLSAALLDAAGADDLAAVVPKGYFAVYVGAGARQFVVPTAYLRQPAFRDLMERAAEEFGFAQAGGIRIPCREEDFEATVAALEEAAAAAAGAGRPRWRRRPGRIRTAMVRAMWM